MKTKLFMAAVAVAFSFAVTSCGNKQAANNETETTEVEVATVEGVQVCDSTKACCKDAAADCDNAKACCKDKKECDKEKTECDKACDKACEKK